MSCTLFHRLVPSVSRERSRGRLLAKRPPARLALEGLETRELLSCSALIEPDGVLRVQCDNTSNYLILRHDEAQQVTYLDGVSPSNFRDADFVALEFNFGTAYDRLSVTSTAPDRPVTVNNRGGADWWILGDTYRMLGIRSPFTFNGASGGSSLAISGGLDPEAHRMTLSSFDTERGTYGSISGFPADIAYQFDAVRDVSVVTGAGDDSVCVLDVGEGFSTRLFTYTGNDTLHVAGFRERSTLFVDLAAGDDTVRLGDFGNTLSPFLSPPTIDGGPGRNTLYLVDSGRAEAVTYSFTSNYIGLESASQSATVVYFVSMNDIVLSPGQPYRIRISQGNYLLTVSSDPPPDCGCGLGPGLSPGTGFFPQLDGELAADSTILDALVGAARKSAQPADAWDLGLTL